MTTQELDALQALCDGATPGEWSIQENRMMCAPVIEAGYKHEIAKVLFYRGSEDPEVFPNARFIAASRTAIPALIAEVRRLTEDLDEAIADLRKDCTTCRYKGHSGLSEPCLNCQGCGYASWEWRGPAPTKEVTLDV